jgi:hypothetical protein
MSPSFDPKSAVGLTYRARAGLAANRSSAKPFFATYSQYSLQAVK